MGNHLTTQERLQELLSQPSIPEPFPTPGAAPSLMKPAGPPADPIVISDAEDSDFRTCDKEGNEAAVRPTSVGRPEDSAVTGVPAEKNKSEKTVAMSDKSTSTELNSSRNGDSTKEGAVTQELAVKCKDSDSVDGDQEPDTTWPDHIKPGPTFSKTDDKCKEQCHDEDEATKGNKVPLRSFVNNIIMHSMTKGKDQTECSKNSQKPITEEKPKKLGTLTTLNISESKAEVDSKPSLQDNKSKKQNYVGDRSTVFKPEPSKFAPAQVAAGTAASMQPSASAKQLNKPTTFTKDKPPFQSGSTLKDVIQSLVRQELTNEYTAEKNPSPNIDMIVHRVTQELLKERINQQLSESLSADFSNRNEAPKRTRAPRKRPVPRSSHVESESQLQVKRGRANSQDLQSKANCPENNCIVSRSETPADLPVITSVFSTSVPLSHAPSSTYKQPYNSVDMIHTQRPSNPEEPLDLSLSKHAIPTTKLHSVSEYLQNANRPLICSTQPPPLLSSTPGRGIPVSSKSHVTSFEFDRTSLLARRPDSTYPPYHRLFPQGSDLSRPSHHNGPIIQNPAFRATAPSSQPYNPAAAPPFLAPYQRMSIDPMAAQRYRQQYPNAQVRNVGAVTYHPGDLRRASFPRVSQSNDILQANLLPHSFSTPYDASQRPMPAVQQRRAVQGPVQSEFAAKQLRHTERSDILNRDLARSEVWLNQPSMDSRINLENSYQGLHKEVPNHFSSVSGFSKPCVPMNYHFNYR